MIPEPAGRKAGVSLMEMLLALLIFSVIAIPVIVIPARSLDQTEIVKNSTLINYEISNFFYQFQKEVNLTSQFFPIAQTNPALLNWPGQQVLFLAYWDPIALTEQHVGYAFQELKQSDGTTYSPRRFQLMRAQFNGDQAPLTLSIGSSQSFWQPFGRIVANNQFYFFSRYTSEVPQFIFCQGSNCNNINPAQADSVVLQSGTSGTANATGHSLDIAYRNSSTYGSQSGLQAFPLYYFKVGTNKTRVTDSTSVSAFSVAISALGGTASYNPGWGSFYNPGSLSGQGWISELLDTTLSPNAYRPVRQYGEISSGTELQKSDPYFDPNTGNLWIASSSNTPSASGAALYVYKIPQKTMDYLQPYNLSTGNSSGIYQNNFPIVVHSTDAAWPLDAAGSTAAVVSLLSVTLDSDQNIYALARAGLGTSTLYWVLKFSASGQYISRFSLGNSAQVAAGNSAGIGIAYVPDYPDEIMVLLKNAAGNPVIRSYPKDQNQDDPSRVTISAESAALNQASMTPATTAGGQSITLDWAKARGFDYDTINKRYYFVFGDATTQAAVLSLDSDLRPSPPASEKTNTPAQRALVLNAVYYPYYSSSTGFYRYPPLYNPTGIAYDATTNTLFITTDETVTPTLSTEFFQTASPKLYIVYPSIRLTTGGN